MTLGTILADLGLSVAAATIVGLILVAAFAALLIVYLKRMEEKELADRFGEAYLAYRRDVPFIIPRIPRKG
jgi:protein-S-isoprenylcysteine O-methyltransferase Ste14